MTRNERDSGRVLEQEWGEKSLNSSKGKSIGNKTKHNWNPMMKLSFQKKKKKKGIKPIVGKSYGSQTKEIQHMYI